MIKRDELLKELQMYKKFILYRFIDPQENKRCLFQTATYNNVVLCWNKKCLKFYNLKKEDDNNLLFIDLNLIDESYDVLQESSKSDKIILHIKDCNENVEIFCSK